MAGLQPERTYPPLWRVALAFLIVPGVAAVLMAMVFPLYAGLPNIFERIGRTAIAYAMFGAYPPALLFGIPVYFVLRKFVSFALINCSLTGGLIAILPWILLVIFAPEADQASVNGIPTVVDGRMTAYGWLMLAKDFATVFPFGLGAGVLFWAIVAAGNRSQRQT